jgi:hypothetical protein
MTMPKYKPVKPYNPNGLNPALMTYDEYYKLANPEDKYHPNSAYDTSLEEFNNKSYNRIEAFPILLKRVKINGIYFQIRLELEPLKYTKKDADGEHSRDADNNIILLSKEEIKQKNLSEHDYNIGIFNEENECVGRAQDEWGCVLITVAREYRGFGFGTMLGKLARHFEPDKSSGGFTPAGARNFFRVYQEFVRDALRDGLYNRLVRSGEVKSARVYDILKSARLEAKPKQADTLNLSISDPKDWLVLSEYGGFTVYDKKLKDVYIEHHTWGERFILGHIFVEINEHRKAGLLAVFGANTDKIKRFLVSCVASFCADEGVPLALDPDDLKYADPAHYDIGEEDMSTGYRRTKVQIKKKLNLNMVTTPDRYFRRTFDQYGEFKNSVLELGESKFS